MNVTEVVFSGFYKTQICGLYQYDYGQVLKFTDITLPSTYEVHFAQSGASNTVTVLGDENGVQIPDQYLLADLDIRAYIYLHEEDTDGETVYQVLIPVIARPEPSDLEPTPVQQDAITQAIAALNTAVSESSQSAREAAQSAQDAAESAASIDMSNYATKAELQSEESARSLADTSLGNDINAETQRATQAEASIRLAIPSKTSQLQNDSGFLTSAPVQSVNGMTGAVTIPTATTSANGLMSSTDKANLDAVRCQIGDVKSAFDDISDYKKSNNLLDPTISQTKGFLNPLNGIFTENNDHRTLDYVPVTGGKYFISSNANGLKKARFITEYDSSKTVIPAGSSINEGSGNGTHYFSAYVLLNANTVYVRVTYQASSDYNLVNTMLSCADTATVPTFEYYFSPYYSAEESFIKDFIRPKVHIYASDGIDAFYTAMQSAYVNGNTDVYIHKGTYTYTNSFVESIRSASKRGVPIGNGCRYFFETGARLYCEYTGDNASDVVNFFSPLDSQSIGSDFEIYNLDLVAKNTVYAIHDEANGADSFCKHIYKDCYIELDNTALGNSGNSISKALGGGLGKYEEVIIENCVFKATNPAKTLPHREDASYHGANNSTFTDAKLIVSGCYFENCFRTSDLGENVEAPYPKIIFTGNSSGANANIAVTWTKYAWNNETRA